MSVLLVQGTAVHIPLRDASVHVCVTSPPYYGLRDYGTGHWVGGDEGCDHRHTYAQPRSERPQYLVDGNQRNAFGGPTDLAQTNARALSRQACPRCGAARVDQQLGLEPTIEAYLAAMVQVFREVHRILRNDGTLWINMGDSYASSGQPGKQSPTAKLSRHGDNGYNPKMAEQIFGRAPTPPGLKPKSLIGMPWRLALALQADGWILRSELIWHKLNPMPESTRDRPTRAHEQVFLFAKQARYYYDGEAVREASEGDGRTRGISLDFRAYGHHARSYQDTEGNGTRAMRSVLSLASEPCSFAHFATFPTALVRTCLLASCSAHGVCRECQAPWRRVVERDTFDRRHDRLYGNGNGRDHHNPSGTVPGSNTRGMPDSRPCTTGFAPTCACGAPGDGKSVVFDPFCGSATTVLVARELGHHGVGLDLSYPYLATIARERLGLAQLAAWEGRPGSAPPAVYSDLPLFAAGD